MRRMVWIAAAVGAAVLAPAALAHMKDEELPAGPIRDRHELMESIGDHAKKIGQAMKANQVGQVPPHAEAISAKAKNVTALFPKGSTDEKSRAKPEIWQSWTDFEKLAGALHEDASALAVAARGGGDADAAAKQMFSDCKSCHDRFRKPED
jgi:cytochrome c556